MLRSSLRRVQSAVRVLREWQELRSARRRLPLRALADLVADPSISGRRAIAAIQQPEEITGLLERARSLQARTVLEIGTAGGGTLYLLCCAAARDSLVISVDLPGGPFGGGFSRVREALYRSFSGPEQRVTVIRASSREQGTIETVRAYAEARQGLDLVFVDGDHSLAGVRADFKNYWPLVRSGGLMAFHDINADKLGRGGEAPVFWREVRSLERSEEIIKGEEGEGFGIGLLWKSDRAEVAEGL